MHFKCAWCRKSPRRPLLNSLSTQTNQTEIDVFLYRISQQECPKPKLFTSIDDEDFDFFPISFFWYLVYLIILTSLIAFNAFYYSEYKEPNVSLSHLFKKTPMEHFMDYILMYGVLMISIWDSMFSWYRFYTTKFLSVNFLEAPTQKIIIYFSIYCIVYGGLATLQIHCELWWLFPVVILTHVTFNTYCIWKFSKIVVKSYKKSINFGDAQKIHIQMLKGVYSMRRRLYICLLISTLSISPILIVGSLDIIIYLPIIWSIAAICFTFNYIRNRDFIYHSIFSIYQCFKFGRNVQNNQPSSLQPHIQNHNSEGNLAQLNMTPKPKLDTVKSAPILLKIQISSANDPVTTKKRTPTNKNILTTPILSGSSPIFSGSGSPSNASVASFHRGNTLTRSNSLKTVLQRHSTMHSPKTPNSPESVSPNTLSHIDNPRISQSLSAHYHQQQNTTHFKPVIIKTPPKMRKCTKGSNSVPDLIQNTASDLQIGHPHLLNTKSASFDKLSTIQDAEGSSGEFEIILDEEDVPGMDDDDEMGHIVFGNEASNTPPDIPNLAQMCRSHSDPGNKKSAVNTLRLDVNAGVSLPDIAEYDEMEACSDDNNNNKQCPQRKMKAPLQLRSFATEPIPQNETVLEEQQNEEEFLDDLTLENIDEIRRQKQEELFMYGNDSVNHVRSPDVVDVFNLLISHGFYDRQFVNSLEQLRQFNNRQKKMPKHLSPI